jgi:ABC-type nickel/cobalt efflux system permease component RcnA
MESVLTILIPIVVGLTLLILIVGVISMLRGGNFNARNSNRLMRLRVLSQLVAILLIGAFFLLARH